MRKKARRRAGLLIALLVLAGAGIAGGVMWSKSDVPPAASAAAAPGTPVPTATSAAMPPLASLSTPASTSGATPTSSPATAADASAEPKAGPSTADSDAAAIITDENPPKAAAENSRDGAGKQDKLTSALEEGVKPPPAALQSALEASPTPAAQKPAVHAKLVNRVDAAESKKAAEPKKSADAKKSAKPVDAKDKNAKDKTAKTKNANNKDGDVDLISALVAHTANPAPKQNGKTNHPKLAQADKDASKAGKSGRNEDIVERRGGESTESLLQRCRSLGFIEGELCRWRICSDRWDSDAACKANVK